MVYNICKIYQIAKQLPSSKTKVSKQFTKKSCEKKIVYIFLFVIYHNS